MTLADLQKPADFEALPNRIRELRKALGKSQDAIAAATGMSKMAVSSLERGTMRLTLCHMQRIARALGVYPADLLLLEDNPDRIDSHERALLEAYRRASPDDQWRIQRVALALLLPPHRRKPAHLSPPPAFDEEDYLTY